MFGCRQAAGPVCARSVWKSVVLVGEAQLAVSVGTAQSPLVLMLNVLVFGVGEYSCAWASCSGCEE